MGAGESTMRVMYAAGDLQDAQMEAFKQADYHSHFVNPEHFHYVDRTSESSSGDVLKIKLRIYSVSGLKI
jgi:hypothetical protein